jgi:hypothetical protein
LDLNTSVPLGHRRPVPGETVDRVVCVSECRVQGSVFDEMHRIRERALPRNKADEVYAALLYQAGWFVEWIEGPAAGVDAVIHRAAGEPHHTNLRVLHRSRGPRRLTQPWSMAFRQDSEQSADFAARVAALAALSARQQLEPTDVWRRLSMPHSAGPADRNHCQRVMVCSARGTQSFELVRWLGQTYDCHVTRQRLAGAYETVQDVANDYVDLPARRGAMPRRVVAMARKGLQIGLFQAFLSDYSHVMLLLSGDSQHDMELVQLVIAACARLPSRPVALGIGRTGCDHAPLREAARAGGLVYLDCDVAGTDAKAVWAATEPALEFSRMARYG